MAHACRCLISLDVTKTLRQRVGCRQMKKSAQRSTGGMPYVARWFDKDSKEDLGQ